MSALPVPPMRPTERTQMGVARDGAAWSPRLLQACAMFGLAPDVEGEHGRQLGRARAAAAALRRLGGGQIAFVTGPSGAGKSLILRELAATGPAIFLDPVCRHRWRAGSVVDQFRSPLHVALGCLARAGLADATILSMRPRRLSEGERFRLLLALALGRASAKQPMGGGAAPLLLVDEFCSTLDRTTARSIARTLSRCVRGSCIRAICASANDDILEALAPDILVYQPQNAAAIVVRETKSNHTKSGGTQA